MPRQCKEDNCNTRPAFNLPNEKFGIYCSKHKKENIPSRASSSKLEFASLTCSCN